MFYSLPVASETDIERYYAKFEEKFFQFCDKELSKVNTFFSGKLLLKYDQASVHIQGSVPLLGIITTTKTETS